MKEKDFEELVVSGLYSDDISDDISDVSTFEECGMSADNIGVTVRTKDGSIFQVTITKTN